MRLIEFVKHFIPLGLIQPLTFVSPRFYRLIDKDLRWHIVCARKTPMDGIEGYFNVHNPLSYEKQVISNISFPFPSYAV
jgi:hypothetical protein